LVFEGGTPPPAEVERAFEPHDTGYDVLTLRFSSTAMAADPERTLARVDRWLVLGAEHGAQLGLLTWYPDLLVDPWLRDEVLVPLLTQWWERIEAAPYARILWGGRAPGAPGGDRRRQRRLGRPRRRGRVSHRG
jgi:hypothetical protein